MIPSFLLAWRALVRGHVLTLLLAATALAHLLLPALVRSDGTAAGWREMYIRAVTGATFAFTVSLTNTHTPSKPRASCTVSSPSFVSKYRISSPVPAAWASKPGRS